MNQSLEMVTLADDEEWRSSAVIYLSGTDQKEENGYVIKEILRTGEWPVIPTAKGLIRMPLRIVRDGLSDQSRGLIALREIEENFRAGAISNVQIPLSDVEDNDHKNTTRVNTGFVREVWIEDQGDTSKLVARMEFTEPDVKEKALRGTFADVSPGIPWSVMSRGKKYGACLEHVCITNRPFQDGLGPFVALSDQTSSGEVVHFATESLADKYLAEHQQEDITSVVVDAERIIEGANQLISNILGETFKVESICIGGFNVVNDSLKSSWLIPFRLEGGRTVLSSAEDWTPIPQRETENTQIVDESREQEERRETEVVEPTEPLTPLEQARQFRQARLGLSDSDPSKKEAIMPLSREDLSALNLSEIPESQRAVFQKLLDENVALSAQTREDAADRRVSELEEAGLRSVPGALKFYRQVMLSDDTGPAVVLLSDNGRTETSLTALEILDQFINACKGADGKVVLSDQALASGNDNPPPATADDEKRSFEDRFAAAKEALGRA